MFFKGLYNDITQISILLFLPVADIDCLLVVLIKCFLQAARALSAGDIAIKALDIITIVIPPALPAAMTVGRLYAVSRLKRARIACLNTRAVNVSGSIDCVCFDKVSDFVLNLKIKCTFIQLYTAIYVLFFDLS